MALPAWITRLTGSGASSGATAVPSGSTSRARAGLQVGGGAQVALELGQLAPGLAQLGPHLGVGGRARAHPVAAAVGLLLAGPAQLHHPAAAAASSRLRAPDRLPVHGLRGEHDVRRALGLRRLGAAVGATAGQGERSGCRDRRRGGRGRQRPARHRRGGALRALGLVLLLPHLVGHPVDDLARLVLGDSACRARRRPPRTSARGSCGRSPPCPSGPCSAHRSVRAGAQAACERRRPRARSGRSRPSAHRIQ